MTLKELGIVNDMPRGWSQGKGQPKWHRKVYDMWIRMWSRVYGRIQYFGSLIHSNFKYLSNFVGWIMEEPLFEEFAQTCDKVMWCIDKDSKVSNNRNYYPECMTLTTQSENVKEVLNRRGNPNSKTSVIAINDTKVLLFKSTLDAQNKGFTRRHISKCINKMPRYKTHKGYKWYRVNYKHNLRLRKINS